MTAVDLELGLLNSSTSGCEAADFAGFPAGQIALLQRGACEFSLKAQNAEAAGAVGVIIFNQGNTLERMGLPSGTLGEDHGVTIPVVGATYDRGVEWATTLGVIMRIQLQVATGPFTAANVIAELKGSRPGNVVIAGARLDSDINTPGLNNNGSGAAALLETAVQIARVRPQNTVRFIWWAAGFNGQAGASHYLSQLSAADLNAIALYLDANAIASPNYVFFVYDGDGSLGGASGPAGSAAVESVLRGLYSAAGVPYEQLEYASEHSEFAHAGIPVGGITTGTTGIKSPEEQALYGGTAGEQYDPCYGLPCDTFANFSTQALDMNSDIVASAVLRFGMSTEGVNGVRGRGVYRPAAATSSLSLQ